MKLSDLSLPELEYKHWRLETASYKVHTEIQRRKGTEDIEYKINCLSKKRRIFMLALWKAPNKQMEITELLKRVWNIPESKKRVKSETLRKFLQRLHGDLEKHAILLFVEPVKDEGGKIYAYKIIQPTIKMKKK
jgi:hypothetical protein